MKALRIAALGAAVVIGFGSAAEVRAQATPAPQAGAERAARQQGERGERGRKAGRMMGGLFRGIDLTDDQKAQVKAIHERYRPQMQALRPEPRRERGDDAARPDSASRSRARDLVTRQHAEIRAVLTPTQQATFDRNVTSLKERGARKGEERGARKGGKRGGRRGERAGS